MMMAGRTITSAYLTLDAGIDQTLGVEIKGRERDAKQTTLYQWRFRQTLWGA
jgi:hypothetical protein